MRRRSRSGDMKSRAHQSCLNTGNQFPVPYDVLFMTLNFDTIKRFDFSSTCFRCLTHTFLALFVCCDVQNTLPLVSYFNMDTIAPECQFVDCRKGSGFVSTQFSPPTQLSITRLARAIFFVLSKTNLVSFCSKSAASRGSAAFINSVNILITGVV